jgi:hypothetical protein
MMSSIIISTGVEEWHYAIRRHLKPHCSTMQLNDEQYDHKTACQAALLSDEQYNKYRLLNDEQYNNYNCSTSSIMIRRHFMPQLLNDEQYNI